MSSIVARRLGLIFLIVSTIGCDHVTKNIATYALAGTPPRSFLADTVRLAYVENTGGFLSLGAALPPALRTAVFTVATGLMLIGLAVFALRSGLGGWPVLGLALFAAGGASNWLDRVVRGAVVDFVNVGIGPVRTGVFNVADVAIMVGVGIFLIAEVRREAPADGGDPPAQASEPSGADREPPQPGRPPS